MQEINLYDLIRHYTKYTIFIILITLIGLLGGVVYNQYIQKPLYKSNSSLLLITNAQSVTTYNTTLINNYISLLKSRSVLDPVITNLKLNENYQDLANSLSASNVANTEVIQVSITNKNAHTSANEVNSAVDSFKKEVKQLYGLDNIKVVDQATTPSTTTNIRKNLQLLISVIIGFIFSLIIVFFIYDINISKTKNKTSKKREYISSKALKNVTINLYKWVVKAIQNFFSYIYKSVRSIFYDTKRQVKSVIVTESVKTKQDLNKKTKTLEKEAKSKSNKKK